MTAEDATRALRAAHAGFYLSAKTVSVGLIGPGNVGGVLLDQLAAQAERCCRNSIWTFEFAPSPAQPAWCWPNRALTLETWREAAQASAQNPWTGSVLWPTSMPIICRTPRWSIARRERGGRAICGLVAGTAFMWSRRTRKRTVDHWPTTATAALCVAPQRTFCMRRPSAPVLPIIQTLRDLMDTGDEIFTMKGYFFRHAGVSV